MLKLYFNSTLLFKSLDIIKVYEYIVLNPLIEYTIFKDFEIIHYSTFTRLFLNRIKDFDKYIELETILFETPTIYDVVQDLTNLKR